MTKKFSECGDCVNQKEYAVCKECAYGEYYERDCSIRFESTEEFELASDYGLDDYD